jgi:hypothetical protein
MAFDPCPKGGKLRPADEDHPVQILAGLVNAKAYHAGSGRFIVEYPLEGNNTMSVPYSDQQHAMLGLNSYRSANRAFEKVNATIERAGITRTIPAYPKGPTNAGELDPHIAMLQAANGSPLTTGEKQLDGTVGLSNMERWSTGMASWQSMDKVYQGVHRGLGGTTPIVVNRLLRSLGKWGNVLADILNNKNASKPLMQGERRVMFNQQVRRLLPEEQEEGPRSFHDYIDGKWEPSPDRKAVMDDVYRKFMDQQNTDYYTGGQIGVPLAKELDNYKWPHRHDIFATTHPAQRQRILESIMDMTNAQGDKIVHSPEEALQFMSAVNAGTSRGDLVQSVAEGIMKRRPLGTAEPPSLEEALGRATHLVDNYIKKQGDRYASSLEKERLDNGDRYIKHVRAWDITFQDNARRLAEAYHFGPSDQRIHEAIGHIMMEHNDNPAIRKFLTDIYDYETGRKRTDVPDWLRTGMNMQAAKLSLSSIWNLTGNANSLLSAGPLPFIKGVGRWAGGYVKDVAEGGFGYAKKAMLERVVSAGGTGLHPIDTAWAAPEVHSVLSRASDDMSNSGLSHIITPEAWNGLPSTIGELLHTGLNVTKQVAQGFLRVGAWPFNLTELYVNRGIGFHIGEVMFEDNLAKLMNSPAGSKAFDLYARRLKRLGFHEPQRLIDLANSGDAVSMLEAKRMGASNFIEQTQFRPDLQNLPELATTPLGKLMLQFKTYPINQMRFMMRELNYSQHGDLSRLARAITGLTVGFPALGYALSRARANIMGETISTAEVHRLYQEPGLGPKFAAGMLAMATGGLLGIGMDTAATAIQGNQFAYKNLFMPATASSFINYTSAAVSAGKGLYRHDHKEMQSAYRSALNELGGFGQVIQLRAGLKKQYR